MTGMELIPYMLAVPAAFLLVRKNLDLALVCGVVLGMAAFSLLLGFSDPIKAFGLGLATICLGIFYGKDKYAADLRENGGKREKGIVSGTQQFLWVNRSAGEAMVLNNPFSLMKPDFYHRIKQYV